MKKVLILLFLICLTLFNGVVFAKSKKIKCKKPIYFFENVNKNDFFDYLDDFTQKKKYKVEKFYPELGYISLKYKAKRKPEIVSLSLKQYGSDVYLFIDISKGNTKLEKEVYALLKPHAANSYLIKDDLMCRDLTKDVASINTNRKSTERENEYDNSVYRISMQRYVGYDKKTYFKDKLKRIFKRKKKNKKVKEST
ncbi:MAG: hypothetical protein MJ180_01525 [Candidatus Gastranaerophilales bacterium]|nr:hypothetical protein [Candidatus Gastranaerophilales bacterium]